MGNFGGEGGVVCSGTGRSGYKFEEVRLVVKVYFYEGSKGRRRKVS